MSAEPLAAIASGSGPGLPLLLLHGFLGDGHDWDGFDWGERPVLAVDLPGHGRSVSRPDADYTLEGTAAACIALADRHGWARFALAGYSMGGRIACHVPLIAPGRVAALVAISAHPGIDGAPERADRLAADERRAGLLRRDAAAFCATWYDQPVFSSLAARPGLRRRLEGRHRAVRPDEAARALTGFSTGRQTPVGERLALDGVPLLLVSGTLDEAYDRLLAGWAARHGAEHVRIPQAGHAVPFEQPARLAAAVVRFLKTNDPCP